MLIMPFFKALSQTRSMLANLLDSSIKIVLIMSADYAKPSMA